MATITYSHTGQTFDAPDGASYLEFCQGNDEVPQDFGCTVGSCGTCCVVVEAGGAGLNAITDEERETIEMCTDEEGARLGCQLTVGGDMTVRPAER